jgi:hypothetical protein
VSLCGFEAERGLEGDFDRGLEGDFDRNLRNNRKDPRPTMA